MERDKRVGGVQNIRELREAAWFGLGAGERSASWLILLDVLGADRDNWEEQMKSRRVIYNGLVQGLDKPSVSPDILSPSLLPQKIVKQIEKDMVRMESVLGETLRERCLRAMRIFSRKHPVIGYVQGMGEIFKVFYEVHAAEYSAIDAEMLAYFCFARIVGQALDCFGSGQLGIERSIEEIDELLEKYAQRVKEVLVRKGVEVKYFAYNWMSTFMFREFADYKKVMDAHFSLGVPGFLRFNISFATSVVIFFRKEIARDSFEDILGLLQNLNRYKWEADVLDKILSMAYILYSDGRLQLE
ncbi:TBC1 domain family member 2 [Nematocida homosporus]|uniref:TBC1 domain family member 2 n=1 Tax=Nematocida homosporus TaxID=1912981 RepID=UPI00221E4320|nr:TBC1 domain family member 2 [Nematocida homosporus]KAI5186130.1 TBC1 domain family member 2 [Nematocida homosporus]